MELLREFVDLRGVEKPLHCRHLRRLRTCIFSVSDTRQLEMVDRALQIYNGKVDEVDVETFQQMREINQQLFKQLDANGDGRVSRDEFIEIAGRNGHVAQVFGGYTEAPVDGSTEGTRSILEEVF